MPPKLVSMIHKNIAAKQYRDRAHVDPVEFTSSLANGGIHSLCSAISKTGHAIVSYTVRGNPYTKSPLLIRIVPIDATDVSLKYSQMYAEYQGWRFYLYARVIEASPNLPEGVYVHTPSDFKLTSNLPEIDGAIPEFKAALDDACFQIRSWIQQQDPIHAFHAALSTYRRSASTPYHDALTPHEIDQLVNDMVSETAHRVGAVCEYKFVPRYTGAQSPLRIYAQINSRATVTFLGYTLDNVERTYDAAPVDCTDWIKHTLSKHAHARMSELESIFTE